MKSEARVIALGGVLAALAVVIMGMGGMIPIATYVIPMLCMLMLQLVFQSCGKRIAWGWYGAVAILGVLMCPDKEAAAVFAALGYYPMVKPWLDRKKAKWLWKTLFFNAVILLLYWLLLNLFGLEQVVQDLKGVGIALTAVLLLMGNVTFLLLDLILGRRLKRRR